MAQELGIICCICVIAACNGAGSGQVPFNTSAKPTTQMDIGSPSSILPTSTSTPAGPGGTTKTQSPPATTFVGPSSQSIISAEQTTQIDTVGPSTTLAASTSTPAGLGGTTKTQSPPATTFVGPISQSTPTPAEPTTPVDPVSPSSIPTTPTPAGPDGTTNTQAPATTSADPCSKLPCVPGSTCQALDSQNFVCLCLPGDYYNQETKICERVRVFPGHLIVPELIYLEDMEHNTSQLFKVASQKIVVELNDVFNSSDGYTNSTVLKLGSTRNHKVLQKPGGPVVASVEIIFAIKSDISTESLQEKMANVSKCDDCLLAKSNFTGGNLCDKGPCDSKTTTCVSVNGFHCCTCKTKYIVSKYSERLCIACPSGTKAVKNRKCVNCPFGRSGLNCEESWHLILTIIGSLLGGLLLIALILLPIVSHRSSKASSKRSKYTDEKLYVSPPPIKTPVRKSSLHNNQGPPVTCNPTKNVVPFANDEVLRLPRAISPSVWDSRTNLEMIPSNSQQNLATMERNMRFLRNLDEMNGNPYTQIRQLSDPPTQTRPQTNAYPWNKMQINPYAKGQTNPNYVHDDRQQFDY